VSFSVTKLTGAESGKCFLKALAACLKGTNFMIDVGDAILPGITRLAKLAGTAVDALMNDPKLASIGRFLLNEFEYFTLWAEANWPETTDTLVTGARAMGDALRFTVELFDTSTVKGMVFAGILITLAAVLVAVTAATTLLMLPLYLLVVAIGLVAYGIYKAVKLVVDSIKSLSNIATANPSGSKNPGIFTPGGGVVPTAPAITTAAETGATASMSRSLGSFNPDVVTVQGEEQGKGATENNFDFSGMQVGANVDTDDLTQKIRSQVTKALSEAA
jgi:hypothetical protein